MKKIKWTIENNIYIAKVGIVTLSCVQDIDNKNIWRSYSYIDGEIGSLTTKYGPVRNSLNQVQEDSITMARELLFDLYAAVCIEMKNFDLDENQ